MRERDIFIEVLEKASRAEREACLNAACGDDLDLRRRVEQLLVEHQRQESFFLDASPAVVEATLDQPLERPGAQIGPYKLIEQIGEGGMGTVWMAQQTEPVRRLVAVKLIKAGMDSAQVIARFEAERQALALMDHANIARVLDAGTTDAGRPYFVMDLVRGVPITRYCDEHHLTPKARLELFIPVCQAIQHAHQKGIIHRDLKPSNVLVALYDGKPVPKVIDFGVAKATGQSLTDKTLVTGFGNIVGTLEYMSPEQAEVNQLDIDTRSDIYSLGVLLYELLTGSPPFSRKELEQAGMLEMLRVIREQEPSKPSTKLSTAEGLPTLAANRGTEPAKLTKLVRGELDWIVMKALEKDRGRRYETANGLAQDLQRYLSDEPVQACPPSVGYRLRKFARRNKSGLAVAALVLFFLVLLGSGFGWAVRDRAAREADLASERETRQAKVSGQVELILGDVERLQGEQKWDEAWAAAQRAEAALAGDDAGPLLHEKVRQAVIDLEVVRVLEELRIEAMSGRLDAGLREPSARKYAEVFHQYGIDVEKLPVDEAAQLIRSRPLITPVLTGALDFWAFVRFETDAGGGKLTAVAQAADPDPWRRRVRDALLRKDWEALAQLAQSEEMLRQPPTTLYLLALALQDRGRRPEGVEVLRHAQRLYPSDFWINHILGLWLLNEQSPQEAIGFMRAAVAVRPQSSGAIRNLGDALRKTEQLDEAVAAYYKAIELDPKNASAYSNLGALLCDKLKQYDQAIECFHKAIQLEPKNAAHHNNLGVALRGQKKLDEAVAAYNKAIELEPKQANAYSNLGALLCDKLKQYDQAIECFHKAIHLEPKKAAHYFNLGNALRGQKKLDEAIAAYRKAIEIDLKYASAYSNLGLTLVNQDKLDEAVAAYRKAIELEPEASLVHNNLGVALRDQRKLDEAVAAYNKAIELDPKDAGVYSNLGLVLVDQKKLDEAVAACRKAIDLDPKSSGAYTNLGVALIAQQKLNEAIAACNKALDLDPKNAIAYSGLGSALSKQKKLEDAVAAYRKAIELDPKDSTAYINLGIALQEQKKLDEAIAAFNTAIKLDPKNATAYSGLGIVLGRLGDHAKAAEYFRKAVELDQTDANAYFNLGNALFSQKKRDEAVAAFQEAIKLDPTISRAYSGLGSALFGQGKFHEAVAAYNKALTIDPQHASAHNGLAWLLATAPDAKARDPARAVELANRAVKLAPQQGVYWNTLGAAHYRAGDWKAAIAALEKSMEFRQGGDSGDWFFLAMANWRLDEKDTAREFYFRAVEWMDENQPTDEELLRDRAEAAELLGVKDKQD